MMKIRVLNIDPILTALRERPHEFVLGEYTLTHEPSGFEIWICSGMPFYRIHRIPTMSANTRQEASFSVWQKIRFHRAFIPFKRAVAKSIQPNVANLDAEIRTKFAPGFDNSSDAPT